MIKKYLSSEQEIKDAIKGGDTVHWRSVHSTVERTVGGNYNIKTRITNQRYSSTRIAVAIQKFGMDGFYTHDGEEP